MWRKGHPEEPRSEMVERLIDEADASLSALNTGACPDCTSLFFHPGPLCRRAKH